MDVKIAPDWKELLSPEFEKPYFAALTQFVRQEYATHRIYPRGSNIFRAFDKCPFDKLKVVIIGQDPYHGPGQANGLCFSVGDGVPFPPSLQNIFKEVSDDTGTPIPLTGNLDRWAEQGVLLLNAVLTVRAHEAASHAGHGWETSPTPWYAPSPSASRVSSTCSGAAMHRKKAPSPTRSATAYSRPCIPRRCRSTAGSSAAAISRAPTNTSAAWGRNPSCGKSGIAPRPQTETMTTKEIRTDSLRAWLLAARPKTLTGAAVPVMLGCGLAAADGGFVLLPAVLCLAFALLMQIDANLINDLWDYLKGSDGEDRLGPERACAQGWITPKSMRLGIAATTLAACAAGCGLIAYGGWWLIAVGAACVLFAFLYTAGPYPLAYHGWGDMLVLLFFGFVPVGCTYYVLCGGWTWQVAVVAAACGLVIDTLLMVNNYRDREQDARSGKRTLVVRLGERAGQRLYLLSGFAAAALCLGLWGDGRTWAALLPLLYLPPHVAAWRRMIRIGRGRELNAVLGATSRNILLFGLLLTLGLLL